MMERLTRPGVGRRHVDVEVDRRARRHRDRGIRRRQRGPGICPADRGRADERHETEHGCNEAEPAPHPAIERTRPVTLETTSSRCDQGHRRQPWGRRRVAGARDMRTRTAASVQPQRWKNEPIFGEETSTIGPSITSGAPPSVRSYVHHVTTWGQQSEQEAAEAGVILDDEQMHRLVIAAILVKVRLEDSSPNPGPSGV